MVVTASPQGDVAIRPRSTPAQRLEAENTLGLVRRSCRGGARALPRHSEIWSLARTRRGNLGCGSRCSHESLKRELTVVRIDAPRMTPRRLLPSLSGGVAACEQLAFSRERIGRRRASEAGARASISREPIASTRLVGAGRTGPIRSASDAVGEQPGLESGVVPRW